ncbi:MAG TPA: hypothetical protein ENJ82_15220 [Bacteroidetes bacterium]|nr:hypothetical protein [Bacteroidota bacterium]
MRKLILLFFLPFVLFSCKKDPVPEGLDLREEMRLFVQRIAATARQTDPGFIVIPQNGADLVVSGMSASAPAAADYLSAIDGIGQEDLLYGYNRDDQASPASEVAGRRAFLDIAKANGVSILVTDYCSTPSNMDNSYAQNAAAGYVSFAADDRNLSRIPGYPSQINRPNANDILSLDQVQNFLYLINDENFASRQAFIDAVVATNYDLVIMDLFFKDGSTFTASDLNQLHLKANGRRRLVVSYMSIGEAEDYRYYWQSQWKPGKPTWLDKENKQWKGNYKVHYWDLNWQDYIYRGSGSYLSKILSAGFDGAYLDIIDGFEYYE